MSDRKTDRAIVEAATPGPWEIGTDAESPIDDWYVRLGEWITTDWFRKSDARFIAHFNPSKVAKMLDEIAKLKAENERLKTDKTVMIASCKNCKQLKTENERLQAEWTDVPDEYENWRDFARYMQDLVDTRDDTFEKMMDQRDAALAENEQLKAENERLIGILKDWERGSKSNIESYNKLKADRDALKSENERLKYDLSEANIAINENKRGTHLILAERDAALACVEKLKDLLSEAGPLYWINEEDMDGAANWEKKVSEMLKLLSRFKGAINWQPGKAGSE